QFFSTHYLRLRENCQIGLLAQALDKVKGSQTEKRDLIETVFPNSGTKTHIIVGGQQRVCTVERRKDPVLNLPTGLTDRFTECETNNGKKHRVKWVLLTPAIFQETQNHPGGWLPSWIDHEDGALRLKSGDISRQKGEKREDWRRRIRALPFL